MKNEKKESSTTGWKEKGWSLIFLLIGALLVLGSSAPERGCQRAEKEMSLVVMYKTDIAYQMEVMNAVATGLGNLKHGIFPNIARASPTLDKTLESSGTEVEATFPTHKSIVFDSTLSRLYLLGSDVVADILRFYANLNDCDVKRVECQDALHMRAGKRLESLSPVCDVYLDSMEATLKCGQRLLERLDLIK